MEHFQRGKTLNLTVAVCTIQLSGKSILRTGIRLQLCQQLHLLQNANGLVLPHTDNTSSDSSAARVVTQAVLSRRTSPLTPRAANRWRLKESSTQVPPHACTSHLQTSHLTVACFLLCLFQKLKSYKHHWTSKSSFANVLLHVVFVISCCKH